MSAGYEPDRMYSYSSPLRYPPCECRKCRASRTEPDGQGERLPVTLPASEPPRYVRCPMLGCGQLHRALPEDPEGIPQ